MEVNKELVNLFSMMRQYDPDITNKKARQFEKEIFDLSKDICVPLTKDETKVYRCLIGLYKANSIDEIAEEMHKHRFAIKKMIVVIRKTLRLYFLDINREDMVYPGYALNDNNKNVTVLELGLSYKAICNLRLFKCYYLKDVSCINLDELKQFLNENDFKILISSMDKNGLPIDWYQKRGRLVMCNPYNDISY